MDKTTKIKTQTLIQKTLHRKLTIKQYEPHKDKYREWSQMEGLEVPAPLATLNIKKNKYRGWSQMEVLEVPAPSATLNIKKTKP